MLTPSLHELVRRNFPGIEIDDARSDLAVGSFPEWDSLANFNFLLLVEETYEIRFSVEEMSELKDLQSIERVVAQKLNS